MINPSPKYSGEPSTQALASGLATLGRYGDNYMVHAAEGETMIPKEIFDENPGLKQDLFRQMTMMGIKDPNRYVVGNALNSINPITGQPEFFFKKIFRAIKKIVKKAAPIIAPIIGNLIAPGIGGIIASGLVTKLQGGSWGDALKSAALSYGASALTSGIGSALQGTSVGDFIGAGTPAAGSTYGGRFMSGLGTGLSAPFSAAGNLLESGASNPLAQGILGPRGLGTYGIFSGLAGTKANPSAFAQGKVGLFPSYQTSDQLVQQGLIPSSGAQSTNYSPAVTTQQLAPQRPVSAQDMANFQGQAAAISRQYSAGTGFGSDGPFNPEAYIQARSAGMNVGAARDVGLGLAKQAPTQMIGKAVTTTGQNALQNVTGNAPTTAANASEGSGDYLKRMFGKKAGRIAEQAIAGSIVPLGIAAVTYALTPEQKSVAEYLEANPMDPNRAAYDKWSGIADKSSAEAESLKNEWYTGPSRYSALQLKSKFGANPIPGITSPSSGAQIVAGNLSNPSNIQGGLGNLGVTSLLNNNLAARNALMARAAGGEIVGPGTGTSDSIPARLSDGEFVMTAQAVRNAGNGDRDVGAARMYDMMNRFERGMA